MEKRIALLAVVLTVVGVCNSVVLALPPMGPPKAFFGEDQWAVDVEFSHGQMDLQGYGKDRESQGAGVWGATTYAKHDIEGLTSNMVFGSLGYGVSENCDVYVRLGAADAQDEISEKRANGAQGNEYRGLDGGLGFAYGLGARTTLWQDGDVTWGGLFQLTWSNPGDGSISLTPRNDTSLNLTGDAELDFWEIQVAIGPTLQLDTFSVYGGPFLHVVRGDLDISVSGVDAFSATWRVESSQDVTEQSQFGGYAGAQWDLDDRSSMYIEYQSTGDAWGVGLGAFWRTE